MAPLKAMLADAYENGLVTVDASRVRVVVSDRGRARTLKPASKRLTGEQTATILAAIPERDRVLFYFLARTGLRIGEALGLKWGDLERTPAGLVLVIDRQAQGGELEDEGKTENALREPWPSCRRSRACSLATGRAPSTAAPTTRSSPA